MLHIQDLSFRYPGAEAPALEHVTLDVQRGEVLGLLGPNGAGKTTLIAHLGGTLGVQQGRIEVDGQALQELRKTQPTCIAVAPQDYAFYPTLTVAENLDCFAGVGGLGGAAKAGRVASCIEFAQLQNYRHVQAQRLSGGLKRRLNLSIALLHRPQLILFDEPTVGVDPQSRAFLLEAVKTLAANGSAVIYTSHYMEEVQAIADRIVVLDGGKVLRQGTLAELLGSTQQLYVALAQGQDRAQLRHILSRWGDGVDQGEGVCLTLPSGTALADVLNILTQAGLELRQVNYGAMNLEQLFMQLTHRSLRD